ncbi:hypothetical protein QQZ08_008930 [Neonectria magnoliae]|uniref:Uncharacterized protein n=1 Tax=Neonectria magnoliae TaxID=2732573 RepID=A0ABR1HRB3_9HYPO
MSLLDPPSFSQRSRSGKRKRPSATASSSADDPASSSSIVSRPAHLPHDSINPLSHTPGMVYQFATAGLAETDEDPSQLIPDFPHRGLGRAAGLGRDVESDSDAETDDEGTKEKKKKKKNSTVRERGRGGPYEVLLQSVQQFLDQGDINKAARAYGLLLQMRPSGAVVDVRRHSLWAIGAEILMRQGEQPRGINNDGDPDYDDLGVTPGGLRRWGRAANINKVKAYFDTLIQQHPYDYKHPRAVCAVDFWVAMLSCEIYNAHTEHVMALDRAVDAVEDEARQSVGVDDSYGSEEPESREGQLKRRKEELRLQALATMRAITKRMGGLMQDLPYSRNHDLLRLRAMASLYVADLVMPVVDVSPIGIHEAQHARQMEQQIARDSLMEIVNKGGQLDEAVLVILYPLEEGGKDPAVPLYSSLPIRGL